MSRKDYIALAEALAAARKSCQTAEERTGVNIAAGKVALALRADNPAFDHLKWFAHFDNIV
jgi:hypothetical protein